MKREFKLMSITEKKSPGFGIPDKLIIKYEDEYGRHTCTVSILSRNHAKYCPEITIPHFGDLIAVIRLGRYGVYQLHPRIIVKDCIEHQDIVYLLTVESFATEYSLLDAVRKYLTGGMR